MQVYADLRILTARPTPDEERLAPHRLFGEIDGAVNFSVGLYEARVRAILASAEAPLIFVGGTGLYFRALTQGLSDMPDIPERVRAEVRASAEGRETPELHDELARVDPAAARRLRPSDRQRLLRALEVFYAAGRSLTAYQNQRAAPALAPGEWRGLFLAPEREALKRHIETRFSTMLANGALEEVARLAERESGPGAAGHARARRAAPDGAPARRNVPGGGRRARGTRYEELRQTAVYLGAASVDGFCLDVAGGG